MAAKGNNWYDVLKWVEKVIESCETRGQAKTARKLVKSYFKRYERELGELYLNPWEFEPTDDGNYRLKDTETKEESEHNRRVFKLASTIDDKEWRELWNIFKGQSILDYKKYMKTLPKEEQATAWDNWFNGSDMRGWWD